ncbi:sugar phosphate isomerase/epimerase family protein [Verrucomicrobiota bacterium]
MKNEIGVITSLTAEGRCLERVADFGLDLCQLSCWNPDLYSTERAKAVRRESEESGVRITSLWAGWPGPAVWDFVEGPLTLGLVPPEYRDIRIEALVKGADFAHSAGIPAIATHLGFIPENPGDPVFGEMVDAVRGIAERLKGMGMEFWFETGQETPVAMLRLIEEVGTGNLGVNLDPANLILYGKASPVDSLDVFGRHVRGVHAKDGLYPTDPMKLGAEVKVGEGRVRFPELVRRLRDEGFDGAYIIEREISGEQQNRDIAETVAYLRSLLADRPEAMSREEDHSQ